ncbi:hypothetical protein ACGF3C_27265 [Micromonospora sp. NPDC047762]|uniref:hypothetical protein n=1 Tax=Micromonospora sp. NPDC047762 TaxID=3364255 RepID=UPI003722B7EF
MGVGTDAHPVRGAAICEPPVQNAEALAVRATPAAAQVPRSATPTGPRPDVSSGLPELLPPTVGSRRYADPASFVLTPEAWALQKVEFGPLVGKAGDTSIRLSG